VLESQEEERKVPSQERIDREQARDRWRLFDSDRESLAIGEQPQLGKQDELQDECQPKGRNRQAENLDGPAEEIEQGVSLDR
jgi:hypothetical protein